MTEKKEEPIDLLNVEPEPNFLCEFCIVAMLPYPKARVLNPHAGPSYICPHCGIVIDSLLQKPQYEDVIKPIDLNPFTIDFVPDDKDMIEKPEPYDPEPQEDEQIKAMGGTIIRKQIDVRRDY